MKLSTTATALAVLSALIGSQASPVERLSARQSALSGYASFTFKDADACIYMSLSNGNNATSFRQVNDDKPILCATQGTRGARDPAIVRGDDGTYYIMATDLNIAQTNWGAAVTTGSRGIFVWQSTDLINWTDERLITVEDATAGMVWAPSGVSLDGTFHVFWSSRFFAADDSAHTGAASSYVIRTASTSDFRTFSRPSNYAEVAGTNLIDQEFLQLDGDSWIRLLKNETLSPGRNFLETSSTGVFGQWTRVGDYVTDETDSAEGAALYKDNLDAGVLHMAQDKYTTEQGYVLYDKSTADVADGSVLWKRSAQQTYPAVNKHGSFIQLTGDQYTALNDHFVR